MSDNRRGHPWVGLARVIVSIGLLWLVSRRVDVGVVLARLGDLRSGWVALALALTVPQVLLLAWRWRLTAARLGIDLPFRVALGEYYLGILLNQVLPGGVLGDVSRAWRHARGSEGAGPAVRAVILERLSAQAVMTLAALACVLALPWAGAGARLGTGLALVAVTLVALAVLLRLPPSDTAVGRLVADARRAVLARDAAAVQLLSAAVVVGSYIAVYLLAARAVGVDTPLATMLPLVAPVLMTMLVPVTVAGWGVREAAAAWLWPLAGLGAEEGAAVSVAYGLLVLASSAPGLIVLAGALLGSRDRTARPPPG